MVMTLIILQLCLFFFLFFFKISSQSESLKQRNGITQTSITEDFKKWIRDYKSRTNSPGAKQTQAMSRKRTQEEMNANNSRNFDCFQIASRLIYKAIQDLEYGDHYELLTKKIKGEVIK